MKTFHRFLIHLRDRLLFGQRELLPYSRNLNMKRILAKAGGK